MRSRRDRAPAPAPRVNATTSSRPDGTRSGERFAIAVSNLGHVYTHMFTILYASAVLHLPSVFALGYGELLELASVGLVLFGVGALPAGWLGDRWSQVGMMVIFFVGLGAGSLVTGLASGPGALFVGLSLIGLFASIYHPVGIAWLVACARRRGIALGVNSVFGGVGSAAAPVFVGLMIDHVTWRAAFVIPGIASVVTGIVLWLAWRRGAIRDVRSDRAPPRTPGRNAMRRVFVVLTLTMACNGFIYTGLTHTMPKIFESGLSPALAGSYTEIGLYVGAVIGLASACSLLGGWLADRFSARAIYVSCWLAMVIPVFVLTSTFGTLLLVVAALAMAFNATFAAAENMLVAHYTPFRWRSLAYGAKFVLALGVGGLTVSLAGRTFESTGSFDPLYLLFTGAALAAALGAMMLPGRRAAPVEALGARA